MPDDHFLLIRIGKVLNQRSYFVQIRSDLATSNQVNQTYPLLLSPADISALQSAAMLALEDAVGSDDSEEREINGSAGHAIKVLGKQLYSTLTKHPEVEKLLGAILSSPQGQHENLLVLFQFEVNVSATIGPFLWEALVEPKEDRFFLYSKRAIARYVPSGRDGLKPAGLRNTPLKMLLIGSSFAPGGKIDAALEKEILSEKELLEKIVGDLVQRKLMAPLEYLANPTLQEIQDRLDDQEINILHFIGHGTYDQNKQWDGQARGAYIMLREPKSNTGRRVGVVDDLQAVLNRAEKSLRLVVLSACQLEAQANVAARLVASGVAAVITMRAQIGTEVIMGDHGFTETLYKHIAAGKPVHSAFSSAVGCIRNQSAVEAFIPTLVLGSLTEIALINPASPPVKQLRTEIEPEDEDIYSWMESLMNPMEATAEEWDKQLQAEIRLAWEVSFEAAEEMCTKLKDPALSRRMLGETWLQHARVTSDAGMWLVVESECGKILGQPALPDALRKEAARLLEFAKENLRQGKGIHAEPTGPTQDREIEEKIRRAWEAEDFETAEPLCATLTDPAVARRRLAETRLRSAYKLRLEGFWRLVIEECEKVLGDPAQSADLRTQALRLKDEANDNLRQGKGLVRLIS